MKAYLPHTHFEQLIHAFNTSRLDYCNSGISSLAVVGAECRCLALDWKQKTGAHHSITGITPLASRCFRTDFKILLIVEVFYPDDSWCSYIIKTEVTWLLQSPVLFSGTDNNYRLELLKCLKHSSLCSRFLSSHWLSIRAEWWYLFNYFIDFTMYYVHTFYCCLMFAHKALWSILVVLQKSIWLDSTNFCSWLTLGCLRRHAAQS